MFLPQIIGQSKNIKTKENFSYGGLTYSGPDVFQTQVKTKDVYTILVDLRDM